MLQSIAKGYIDKNKRLNKHPKIDQQISTFTGEIKIGEKPIIVEIYTDGSTDGREFGDKIFIKLSVDSLKEISRVL